MTLCMEADSYGCIFDIFRYIFDTASTTEADELFILGSRTVRVLITYYFVLG